MTDAQRRFAAARDRVQDRAINPLTELIDAAQFAVVEADRRATRAEMSFALLRQRVDGQDAKSILALSTLWSMLEVDNQTEAVARLEQLLKLAERTG